MCALYKHALCLLLAVGLSAPLHAQPQDATVTLTAHDVGVDNTARWRHRLFDEARYHAGDNPAWADPAFDDQRWEIAETRLLPRSLPQQGWPGIGWFRVRLRLEASLRDQDLGFIVHHTGAVEVYLDGSLVYHSGKVGATRAEEEPFVDLEPFVLPLEAGAEHVLAVRYSSATLQGFRARWGETGFIFYWGERATMMRRRRAMSFEQGAFSAFLLAFALLFGLLYALYRSERLFLYTSIFYSFVFSWVYLRYQIPFVHTPEFVMPLRDTHLALGASVLLAGLYLLYAFFYEALPRLFYGFLLMGIAVVLLYVVRANNDLYVLVFAILIFVEWLRVVAVALWRRKRWAWIVGLGFVPLILFQVWERFYDLGLVAKPWEGTPFDPTYIEALSLAISMAAYVGIRFAEANRSLAAANRELAEANRTLEDKVARRTAKLRASQAQLIQSEKMASLGQLTAGIAHEIKNPLNFVNNFAQLSVELADELAEELDAGTDKTVAEIRDGLGEILADLKQNAAKINEHGRRADGIVKSMLEHARSTPGERRATDLNALLDKYVNLAFHGMRAQQQGFRCDIERKYDETVGKLELAPKEIGRVFLNLLKNAFEAVHEQALKDNGDYLPTVRVSTRPLDGVVEVRVCDNGPGIPPEIHDKIFEPFFTTKPTGSGMGLSLAYDIVTQGHGGTLTVERAKPAPAEAGDEGATLVITLPRGSRT